MAKVELDWGSGTKVTFDHFTGRPQLPHRVVETYTRIGSKTLQIQELRREATITPCVGTLIYELFDKTNTEIITLFETELAKLMNNVGKVFTMKDFEGITISRCYLTQAPTYTMQATSGAGVYRCTVNLLITRDEA